MKAESKEEKKAEKTGRKRDRKNRAFLEFSQLDENCR